MKKLHKNFNSIRETIESMMCDCHCWCATDCTSIYNYVGYLSTSMALASAENNIH